VRGGEGGREGEGTWQDHPPSYIALQGCTMVGTVRGILQVHDQQHGLRLPETAPTSYLDTKFNFVKFRNVMWLRLLAVNTARYRIGINVCVPHTDFL
jgi:hypothetical protein